MTNPGITNLIAAFDAGAGNSARINGHEWKNSSGLTGSLGTTGGTAGTDAWVILDASGNGMQIAPTVGYAAWAATNSASTDPATDSNHNGVPNGVEYFMGATAAKPATLPPLVNTAGTWTWTIPYDPTAAASYDFEVSANLQSWTQLSPGNPAVAVLTSQARLRLTLPSGMRFCRLVVTPAP